MRISFMGVVRKAFINYSLELSCLILTLISEILLLPLSTITNTSVIRNQAFIGRKVKFWIRENTSQST